MELAFTGQHEAIVLGLWCGAAALALVLQLWGLRIFTALIIGAGALLGGLLGFAGGVYLHDTQGLQANYAYAFAAAGALIGGAAAWPLRRAALFTAAGLCGGALAIVAAAHFRLPEGAVWAVGAGTALVAGLAAMLLYRGFVVLVVALAAGFLLLQADSARPDSITGGAIEYLAALAAPATRPAWDLEAQDLDAAALRDRALALWEGLALKDIDVASVESEDVRELGYGERIRAWLEGRPEALRVYGVVLGLSAAFALAYQLAASERDADALNALMAKQTYRRAAMTMAALALLAYGAARFIATPYDLPRTLLGFGLLTWMAPGLAAGLPFLLLGRALYNEDASRGAKFARYALALLVAAGLAPAAAWLAQAGLAGAWPPPRYYEAFLPNRGSWALTAVKAGLAIVVVPALLYVATSRRGLAPPPKDPSPLAPLD